MANVIPIGFDEAGGVDPSLPDPREENFSKTSGPTENSTTYSPPFTRLKAQSQCAGMTT